MRVAVTGASGFVGSAVVARLAAEGHETIAIGGALAHPRVHSVPRVDLLDGTGWDEHLAGVNTVVHTAARVHRLHETISDPLPAYRAANVEGTKSLAHAAVREGVKRIVFISSIKVNGESTAGRGPFTAAEIPRPADPYGISKLEAEQALFEIGRESGIEVVVIRPPLVYGPGVKANFQSMIRIAAKGWPLPLGQATAPRSLIGIDNLVDLIEICSRHPAAPGHVFLVSDGVDLGVGDMIRMLARVLGRPARLLPVPARMLELAGRAVGRRDVAMRLLGTLQVDIAQTRRILDWNPPVGIEEAFRRAAAGARQGRAP